LSLDLERLCLDLPGTGSSFFIPAVGTGLAVVLSGITFVSFPKAPSVAGIPAVLLSVAVSTSLLDCSPDCPLAACELLLMACT
jgi:hypothetical protein